MLQQVSKKLFLGIKYDRATKTLSNLKLDSQTLTLCVQMLVLIFALDGHTVTTPWSLCCVHVRLIICFLAFLGLGFIYVYLF